MLSSNQTRKMGLRKSFGGFSIRRRKPGWKAPEITAQSEPANIEQDDDEIEALESEVSRIQEEIEALKFKDFEAEDQETVENVTMKIAKLQNQTEMAIQHQLSDYNQSNIELDSRGRELAEFGLQFETVMPRRQSSLKFHGSCRKLKKTLDQDLVATKGSTLNLKFKVDQLEQSIRSIKSIKPLLQ